MSSIFPLKTLHLRAYHRFFPRFRVLMYKLRPNIYIDPTAKIGKNVVIRNHNGGKIYIGKYSCIDNFVSLFTEGGDIEIGDNSTVNSYTIIYGQGGTKIGNGVRIAANCTIIPSNHNFNDINIPIYKSGLTSLGITIEDNVWIGTGVRILDGVHIATGCVIGAGSVVTKSTEKDCIYVGVPARKLKHR